MSDTLLREGIKRLSRQRLRSCLRSITFTIPTFIGPEARGLIYIGHRRYVDMEGKYIQCDML